MTLKCGDSKAPSTDWWMIIASGQSGTVNQVAYGLWGNVATKTRRCAGGSWSS